MTEASRDWAVAERAWGAPEPEPAPWSSGPWTLERRGDELADIRFEGAIVLRMVRAVARDRDWSTVPTEVTDVREGVDRLEVDVRMSGFGADIVATVVVTAGHSLRFSFDATSGSDFERNRLGFVVLHAPDVAGAPLAVVHPDGSRTATTFPDEISPHQPAFDIAALEWTSDGLSASLGFEGDVFEMEDQRNWTDASFKTYSTPLSLPFPVLLAQGEKVHQALELSARRVAPAAENADAVVVLRAAGVVPTLVLGASTAPGPQPEAPVPGRAVLVEVVAGTANASLVVDRAAASGLPLDLRIVAREPRDIDDVLALVDPARLARIGVFAQRSHVSEPDLWARLVEVAKPLGIPLVAGARSHFTELNRTQQRLPADADGVVFSVTPQMHAHERSQLVESIAMQRIVARDAARIADGRPVHIGPVTLRSRYNAVATTPPPPERADLDLGYGPALFPEATDPRQGSTALAAWTVASFAALSSSGAASIAYFEQWGPRGVVSSDGSPYPVLEAVELLDALGGRDLLLAEGDAAGIHVLGATDSTGTVVIAANLTPRERTVRLEWPGGSGELTVPAYGVSHFQAQTQAGEVP